MTGKSMHYKGRYDLTAIDKSDEQRTPKSCELGNRIMFISLLFFFLCTHVYYSLLCFARCYLSDCWILVYIWLSLYVKKAFGRMSYQYL